MTSTTALRPKPTFAADLPGTELRPNQKLAAENQFEKATAVNPGTTLRANPKLATQHPILFEKVTPKEEHRSIITRSFWCAVWWVVLSAYAAGWCNAWVMGAAVNVIILRWMLANHDCLHMPSALRTGLAFRTCASPPLGFLPVQATFGDNLVNHLKDHHLHTKSVLDVHDPDSWWGTLPLPLMLVGMMLYPAEMSGFAVLKQYALGPKNLWNERILATLVLWTQCAALHVMGVLMPALIASHVACATTFIVFHGLLHRPSWYKFLINHDPTGHRRIPAIDWLMNLVCDPAAWVEIKFHDAHHSHGALGIGCTHIHYASGRASAAQIEQALSMMVDDGLFVDAQGKGVSALEEVGHMLGARRAYLEKMQN